MTLYLYDPVNNTKQETTYEEISELTLYPVKWLKSVKARGVILPRLNCYIVEGVLDVKDARKLIEKYKPKDEVWKPCRLGGMISSYGRYIDELGKMRIPSDKSNRKNMIFSIGYKQYRIAPLVAEHFLFKEKDKEWVIHLDGNYKNNRANNLKYVDIKTAKGWANKFNKKSVYKIDVESGDRVEIYSSIKQAGNENFISPSRVSAAANGRIPTAGGFKWEYANCTDDFCYE